MTNLFVEELVNDDNNDNNDFHCQNERVKCGRPAKKDMYVAERQKILDELKEILGITEENKTFYMYDIDNNEEIQNKILKLKDAAKLYFNAGNWAIFLKENVKKPHMSLLKCILKDMGHEFLNSHGTITRNGKKIKSQLYYIK